MVAALHQRMTALSVDAHHGAGGVATVAEDWQRLVAAGGRRRFFHWHGWWKCFVETLEPEPEQLTFFVVRRGPQPLAILPLKRTVAAGAGLGAVIWRLPLHPHMPLADILCSEDLDLAEMLDALGPALERSGGCWDALVFEPVLAESPLAAIGARGIGRQHVSIVKRCDEIPCRTGDEDFRARLSRNFRSNLNKARNKLARETGVEFGTTLDAGGLGRELDAFIGLEASGWKGGSGTGTAIGLDPLLQAFYRGLVAELAPSGRVAINSLRVEGRLVAGQFCLRDDDTFYVLKLAYDEAWSRVAPGNMLLEHVVMTAHESAGVMRINLVGDPPWFKDWQPSGQDVRRLWLLNDTARGRALAGLLEVKERLKPVYRGVMARLGGSRAAR